MFSQVHMPSILKWDHLARVSPNSQGQRSLIHEGLESAVLNFKITQSWVAAHHMSQSFCHSTQYWPNLSSQDCLFVTFCCDTCTVPCDLTVLEFLSLSFPTILLMKTSIGNTIYGCGLSSDFRMGWSAD